MTTPSSSPIAQSSAPAISLATLRAVLAKGQAAHPELACRMDRAAHIVALRRIEPSIAPANRGACYWVQSECSDREYFVVLSERGYFADQCSCPDFKNRGGPCKHAMAVRLLQACEREEARLGGATPIPTRAYSDDDRFELTELGEVYLTAQQPDPAA